MDWLRGGLTFRSLMQARGRRGHPPCLFLVGSPTLIPRKRSRRFRLLVPSYFESEISHGSPVEGGCTPRVMFALEEVVVHCEIGVLAKDSLESTAQNQVCCKKSTVYVQSVNLGLGVATADTFMS